MAACLYVQKKGFEIVHEWTGPEISVCELYKNSPLTTIIIIYMYMWYKAHCIHASQWTIQHFQFKKYIFSSIW